MKDQRRNLKIQPETYRLVSCLKQQGETFNDVIEKLAKAKILG